MELLTDVDAAGEASIFDFLCGEDVLPENVVSNNLAADDAAQNFACVDADLHIKVTEEG